MFNINDVCSGGGDGQAFCKFSCGQRCAGSLASFPGYF